MRGIPAWLIVGAMVALLPSCSLWRKWFPKKAAAVEEVDPKAAEKISTRVIGEVASVHIEGGFVLIRRYGGGGLPGGYIYNSVGTGGRTATLKPSGERSGRFYAADVTGGTVEVGDVVVIRRLPEGAIPEVIPVQERRQKVFGMP